MKNFFYIIIFLFSVLSFAQDVKLKKGDVIIDDVIWMKYKECGTFDSTCSLSNKNNEELIFFKFYNIKNAVPSTQHNPQGMFNYVEIKFLGLNKSFEIQKRQKAIIEILYNAKVLNEDGTLNPDNVSKVVEKYGSELSKELNQKKYY